MTFLSKAAAFLLLTLCALVAQPPAFALSTYTQSVSSVTSVTIANSSHNLNSPNIGVHVYNSSGVRVADSTFTKSVHPTTYAVSLTFSATFSGTVKLTGAFSLSDVTNADKDFKVAPASDLNDKVSVCGDCTTSNYALILTSQGGKFYSAGKVTYTAGAGASNARVYLTADGRVVFAVPFGASLGTCTGGPCEVIADPNNNFPSGVEQIAEVYFYSGREHQPVVTDHRSWL